jgi:hypothetical protein
VSVFSPKEARVEVRYGQGETTVHIRRPRDYGAAFMMVLFGVFWAFGGLFALALLNTGDGLFDVGFLVVWLIFWAFGMVGDTVLLLWTLIGREKIVIDNGGVTHYRSILIFTRKRRFEKAMLGEPRWVADDPTYTVKVNGRRVKKAALLLGQGTKLVPVLRGIGKREADKVIEAVNQRLIRRKRRRAA